MRFIFYTIAVTGAVFFVTRLTVPVPIAQAQTGFLTAPEDSPETDPEAVEPAPEGLLEDIRPETEEAGETGETMDAVPGSVAIPTEQPGPEAIAPYPAPEPTPEPAPELAPVAEKTQAPAPTPTGTPLEITADQTLEWHRREQIFKARGNAAAKQGETVIRADILTAAYNETEGSGLDIHTLTATGNVVITNPGHTVRGDKAVYDVKDNLAVMTGDILVLETPEQTITANDRFEYQTVEGRLTAAGNVKVIRGQDTMTADTMSAFFDKNAQGENELRSVTAEGNLVIKTPTETLYGNKGTYRAATQTAEVRENVRIERGPNILEGSRAEVNLATDVSKIFGGSPVPGTPSGRVRGVFYPDSE